MVILDEQAPPACDKNLAALVGEAGWARLPRRIAQRFSGAMSADFEGVGRFESNLAGKAFALLGTLLGRPLPMHDGAAAVFIRVRPHHAGEAWVRRYVFAHGAETVRSVKHAGAGAWLEERAGPLVMRLRVFEHGKALVFECMDFLIRIGGFEFELPLALTPGRIRVEHHDHGAGRFAFTLEARHPWLGLTFRQHCDLHDVGVAP